MLFRFENTALSANACYRSLSVAVLQEKMSLETACGVGKFGSWGDVLGKIRSTKQERNTILDVAYRKSIASGRFSDFCVLF